MFFYLPAKSIDGLLYSFIAAAQPVSENKKRNGSQRKYLKKNDGLSRKSGIKCHLRQIDFSVPLKRI